MTYARSRPNELIPWIEEHQVPLLTNAMHRWSYNTDRFLDMWEYDTFHTIDAGGYNVQARFVDLHGNIDADQQDVYAEHLKEYPFYPWTLDEYHEFLSEHTHEFEWATIMDYACEDRFNELWSVEDRIEKTFEATIEHFNKLQDSSADYKLLPVLQGRSLDQYLEFYDRLNAHGIPTDHVGVGTICRISSENKIVELEQDIRENTNIDRIHGFGVKVDAYKKGATFDSGDSQAWNYAPSNGRCVIDDGDRLRSIDMPNDSLTRTVESFKNYYKYVTRLQQGTSAVEYNSGVDEMSDAEAVQALCD